MNKSRRVKRILTSKPTLEGAGVHLRRAFGYYEARAFDPFLLLDDFRATQPSEYLRGFPWHPHRGIETITYMLQGTVEHGDSMGSKGVIGPSDIQWMTAGSGIVHQEMPKGNETGQMGGFQLWANLPGSHKMIDPRYRDVKGDQVPQVTTDEGTKIKIICGSVNGVHGPVRDIIIEPEYLDVEVPAGSQFTHATKSEHTVFAYVIEGKAFFNSREDANQESVNGTLILFDEGERIAVSTGQESARFLLMSGRPIREPIAWGGPIVMNTEEELRLAFEEYETGTFIKHRGS
jgi:redox-sensitive bicupin YhaK (pirin superfamily)